MAKIQVVNGLSVEISVRKYYPSINRLNRRNGRRKGNFLLFEMGKCSMQYNLIVIFAFGGRIA